MTIMCKHDLRHFRILTGPARRLAVRAHLTAHAGIDWSAGHENLTRAARSALDDMARAVSWRKSIGSPLTLAAAYYVYLSRDVARPATVAQVREPRRPFLFGRGAV